VKLIVQPEDGVAPLIEAIDGATKSIEIAIFRFDRSDLQQALKKAVVRGVSVRALIANTNRGGERDLRKLEMDFLAAGIEVARTADDLLRYHYKFMIVDHRVLYLATFNYTYLEIGGMRSFAIVSESPELVREAARLFEADTRRQAYAPEVENFLVSPVNARQGLSHFIQEAKQQLLIYDPEISDLRMIRLLRARRQAGVEIRIIGRVSKGSRKLVASSLAHMRFHTRTIIRDRQAAFVGSQSLREAELERRRELGLIVHDRDVVHSLLDVFESDWMMLTPRATETKHSATEPSYVAGRLTKALVKDLPLKPLVERALKQAAHRIPYAAFAGHKLEHGLEDAFRDTLEHAVSQIVKRTVEAEART
jgi:cardiolipin synthase A/B